MSTPSEAILNCLRASFREYLDEILDDPAHWLTSDAPASIATLRATAVWLGLDYNKLLREIGSGFEIARLEKLEQEGN